MKVYIIGDKNNSEEFTQAEQLLELKGYAPVNPVNVLQVLPEEITNADFTIIAFEFIKICDAVYLIDGWDKDLFARMEYAQADREGKEIWTDN